MNSPAAQYQRNSQSSDRENLILGNVGFVRKILSTMAVVIHSEEERENLNSAGMVGLVQAANAFDSSRGVSFRSFAFPRIHGAIIDELRRLAPVSQSVLQQIGLIKKAYQRLPAPVTPEALSNETGISLDEVERCLEAMRFLKPQLWNDLHAAIHASWKTQDRTPERLAERSEMKQLLTTAIESLPEKERLVVTLYFAEELTLAEIGKVIGNSESRVSRILASAKLRLKEIVRSKTD